ncbi:tail fiber assembly protein [Serratia sp. NPDC078593]|uniref:tail fiber assembly protein n=1 Tax=unclassified Serratia (in: enterobacteria) TaxID=2647522 RepID=UPI0037D89FE5
MNNYTTELPTAVLNGSGLAEVAGWLTVYSIEPVQREYQQVSLEYLPEGVGLPALSFADKPTLPEAGFALVRREDGTAWETLPDYRGQMAYSTATGQPTTVTMIGELAPHKLTLSAPHTSFDKWNGKQWVTDTAAQQASVIAAAHDELAQRQRVAGDKIALLEDAVNLEMATKAEADALLAWKTYRVELSRVNIDTAPDITWPSVPVA